MEFHFLFIYLTALDIAETDELKQILSPYFE